MKLGAIQINDEDAGSIDWELPKIMADTLSSTTPEAQAAIQEFLKRELAEYALILMTAVISRDPGVARNVVMTGRRATTRLLAMANGKM